MGTTMTVEGGTDGEMFRTYVQQLLGPRLRPGQVVMMDYLKAHKVLGIREAIEAAQTRLIYLLSTPPNSHPSSCAGASSRRFYGHGRHRRARL